MRLFSRIAQQAVHTLNKEELEQIMNSALDQMLKTMTKEERIGFIHSLVEKGIVNLLADMDNDDRTKLMNSLLPQILKQLPIDKLDISGQNLCQHR